MIVTEQWNAMLKLKTLPYGSIYPIHNEVIEQEVRTVIKEAVDNDCLNNADIHNIFMQRYREWILETKLHTVKGLELFPAMAFSNGTTESFDKFFLKYKNKRLRYFKGEYMYHINIGKFYFKEVQLLDNGPIEENDVVIISLPFANNGEKHKDMDSVLNQCTKLKVPVMLDCSYFNISGGLEFDFTHECIEEVVFSLSKFMPALEFVRIGVRFTKKDNDDPLFVYNKNRYVNRLSAAIGLAMINRYSSDFNYSTYRKAQLEFCKQLGVNPSSTVTFGTSIDKYPEYNRGGVENRLNFSKFLSSGQLST
jgi:hypothetical protein